MQLPFFKSLRCQIPLMVLVGGIPVILISIGFASLKTTEIISEEIQEKLALQVSGWKSNVLQWNETNILALQNLSRQPDIVSLDAKKQQPILEKMVETYDRFYLVHTTDLTGENIARSDSQAPQKYSDRLWFQGAKAGKSVTYEIFRKETSEQPSMCISVPLRVANRIAAVAANCMLLDAIAQIDGINLGETGYGLIVDEAGKIVAYQDGKNLSEKTTKQALAHPIQVLSSLQDYPPVANLLAGNNGYFTFTDNTNTEWVAYGDRLNNGWGVLILQTKAEALLAERKFQQVLMVTATLLIGGISIFIWLLISSLIEPISELSNASLDWTEGKLDRTANIKRQDELGILANSFNYMARQLQQSFSYLNHRITELENLLEVKERSQQEQKNTQEKLQQQVRDLQRQLEAVEHGDLTVRAIVTEDEIGRIAQSYNQTMENLRRVVAEVQSASQTVSNKSIVNETTISQLSAATLQQQTEITAVLRRLTTITPSIQAAEVNARQVEHSVKQAAEKLQVGDEIIDRTAKQMAALGQNSWETSEQVKRLGKVSQKITKTIGLIRKIALQTNVLAVNASIEAARAGEEGLGFTVIAEEVQSLAAKSAQAATDIEKLISEIQLETNKVVQAMEISSKEVLAGSQSVQEVRSVIKQMTIASIEIDNLLATVNNVVTEQFQANQNITETIKGIAAIAEKNSLSVADVSDSFKELQSVARQLETSMSQFKVV